MTKDTNRCQVLKKSLVLSIGGRMTKDADECLIFKKSPCARWIRGQAGIQLKYKQEAWKRDNNHKKKKSKKPDD